MSQQLSSSTGRPLTQIDKWPQAQTVGERRSGFSRERNRDGSWGPGVGNYLATAETPRRRKFLGGREPEQAQENETTSMIPLREGSVWDFYNKRFEMELDGPTIVVNHKDGRPCLMAIRTSTTVNRDKKLHALNRLRNPALFVSVAEIFFSSDRMYIVREYMSLTLLHILRAPLFPEEEQIAAIFGKVRLSEKIKFGA